MSEPGRGWRMLPAPLLLGFGLNGLQVVVNLLYAVFHHDISNISAYISESRWLWLAEVGTDIAAPVLLAYGAIELVDRHASGARRGLWIAAFGWAAMVLLELVWFNAYFQGRTIFAWIPIIGLAIGAWTHRHRALAVSCLVITPLVNPPAFAWEWIALGYRTIMVLSALFTGAQIAVAAVLTMVLTTDAVAPHPDPSPPPAGCVALRGR